MLHVVPQSTSHTFKSVGESDYVVELNFRLNFKIPNIFELHFISPLGLLHLQCVLQPPADKHHPPFLDNLPENLLSQEFIIKNHLPHFHRWLKLSHFEGGPQSKRPNCEVLVLESPFCLFVCPCPPFFLHLMHTHTSRGLLVK